VRAPCSWYGHELPVALKGTTGRIIPEAEVSTEKIIEVALDGGEKFC